MYSEYTEIIENAKNAEKEINDKFNKEKQELTLQIIKENRRETEFIEATPFEDYSPVKFHNQMTIFNNKFQEIELNKNRELENNEQNLKTLLNKKTGVCVGNNIVSNFYYRIISGTNRFQTIVWFTTSQIPEINLEVGDIFTFNCSDVRPSITKYLNNMNRGFKNPDVIINHFNSQRP